MTPWGPSHIHSFVSCPWPPPSPSPSCSAWLIPLTVGHPSVSQNPGHVMGNQRSLFKESGHASPPSSSVMALFLLPGLHLYAGLGILLAFHLVKSTSCSFCLVYPGTALTVGFPFHSGVILKSCIQGAYSATSLCSSNPTQTSLLSRPCSWLFPSQLLVKIATMCPCLSKPLPGQFGCQHQSLP